MEQETANNIYELASGFALRIVNLYKYLTEKKKEYVISKQLLRSGTSIGANCFEGKNAYSREDFANKMSEKLNGEQAGTITLVAVGIAGLATGTVYLVKAGLKALSSEKAA